MANRSAATRTVDATIGSSQILFPVAPEARPGAFAPEPRDGSPPLSQRALRVLAVVAALLPFPVAEIWLPDTPSVSSVLLGLPVALLTLAWGGVAGLVAAGASLAYSVAFVDASLQHGLVHTLAALLGVAAGQLLRQSRTVARESRTAQETRTVLSSSQELFRTLASNVRAVFWVSAPYRQGIFYVSPAYETVFGQSCETLYQNPRAFMECVHPDDRERIGAWNAAKEGAPSHQQYRIVRPDGTVRWLDSRAFPIRDAAGQIFQVAGVTEDITERKQAEAALRDSERFNRTLLNAIPDVLLWLDRDGYYLDYKDTRKGGLFMRPEQFLGRNVHGIMPPPVAEQSMICIKRALDEEEVQTMEYQLNTAEGPRDYEARVVPAGPHEVLSMVRDVTERKRAEELRRRFIEQIITAQEEERRRIARELHDTMAQSLTSLLVGLRSLDDVVDGSDARERLQELRRVTAATIEDAQRLARGLRPSVLDDMGFSPAVERFVADCARSYGLSVDLHMRGVSASSRLAPTLETALYRILQEALTNVARHAHASNVGVLVERQPNRVRTIVEDNGCGFDVDPTGMPRKGGGLGLLGIRERTALLRGKLTIESAPGRGTTLYVDIPLSDTDVHQHP